MNVSFLHLLLWGVCAYAGYWYGKRQTPVAAPEKPVDPRIKIIEEALKDQDEKRKAAETEATRAAVLASLGGVGKPPG